MDLGKEFVVRVDVLWGERMRGDFFLLRRNGKSLRSEDIRIILWLCAAFFSCCDLKTSSEESVVANTKLHLTSGYFPLSFPHKLTLLLEFNAKTFAAFYTKKLRVRSQGIENSLKSHR